MSERQREHRGIKYLVSDAHPAADVLPWMAECDLQEMADDIAAHGQRDDIDRLRDGRILDGRNRELACRVAGVEPRYITREDDVSDAEAVALVISRMRRRNLTPSQRAMAAAELATLKKTDTLKQFTVPSQEGTVSQNAAAGQLGASVASVERAAKVKRDAPELVESVKQGKLDVRTAVEVAKLPKAKREKVAAADDPKAEAKKQLPKKPPKAAEEPKVEDASGPVEEPAPVDEGAEFVRAVEALCRDMDQIAARTKQLKKSRFGYSIHVDSAASQIEAARKTLWQGRPAHPCPYCVASGSDGCKACNGTTRVKQSTMKIGQEAVGGVA